MMNGSMRTTTSIPSAGMYISEAGASTMMAMNPASTTYDRKNASTPTRYMGEMRRNGFSAGGVAGAGAAAGRAGAGAARIIAKAPAEVRRPAMRRGAALPRGARRTLGTGSRRG